MSRCLFEDFTAELFQKLHTLKYETGYQKIPEYPIQSSSNWSNHFFFFFTKMDIFMGLSILTTLFPYVLYAFTFKYPKFVSRFLNQKQIIHLSQALKLIDVCCAIPTLYKAGVNGAGICVGLPLVFVGQYLNELVYTILGDGGVYYGVELQTVQKRKIGGFPFTLYDPQYKGSIMTIIGGAFCFNTTRDLMIILIPWMVAYFSIIIVENTKTYY